MVQTTIHYKTIIMDLKRFGRTIRYIQSPLYPESVISGVHYIRSPLYLESVSSVICYIRSSFYLELVISGVHYIWSSLYLELVISGVRYIWSALYQEFVISRVVACSEHNKGHHLLMLHPSRNTVGIGYYVVHTLIPLCMTV